MAEDKVEPREVNWRQMMPWTTLFQGFRVALDPNKLILAAFGILLMASGWWLLAVIFDPSEKPKPDKYLGEFNNYPGESDDDKRDNAWKKFEEERSKWHVMHRAAGPAADATNEKQRNDYSFDAGDLATTRQDLAKTREEWKKIDDKAISNDTILPPALPGMTATSTAPAAAAADQAAPRPTVELSLPAIMTLREIYQLKDAIDTSTLSPEDKIKAKAWIVRQRILPPAGAMRTLPWKEDRGPNQFMLITGQAGSQWREGHFGEWLMFKQIPVLLEPLVKLFSPVVYFFNPKAGSLVRFYSLLVMLWTLLVWGFFGGAITRIAAVQVARQEKVGLIDAMRFSARKYTSYLSAPLFPLVLVAALLILMILFGYVQMIPVLGDVLDMLLWGLMILIGAGMAVVLIGLVGWPLMAATVSAEGTDAWEAVSRSYSYVYQAPWHFLWYAVVALAYGAVVVFFVGLMGSLTVYLSKFGVSQTPGINWRHEAYKDRNPTYLFVYAPESFGWRTLLLQDDQLHLVRPDGTIDQGEYDRYLEHFSFFNYPAAVIVSVVWVGLIFMLVLGFGYSYFWSAATIIYLLMRRKVDDQELDEVYLDEEDETAYAGPLAPKPAAPASPPAATPAAPRPSLPVVEAPSRPTAVMVPPPEPPPPPPAPPPAPVAGPAVTEPAAESPVVPPAPPPPEPPSGSDGNPPAGT